MEVLALSSQRDTIICREHAGEDTSRLILPRAESCIRASNERDKSEDDHRQARAKESNAAICVPPVSELRRLRSQSTISSFAIRHAFSSFPLRARLKQAIKL